MRFPKTVLRLFQWCLLCSLSHLLQAKPVEFSIPVQSAATALLAFSQQSKTEVLFPFDSLREVKSTAVVGRYEPENALLHLLGDSGFTVRRDGNGKFVVASAARPTGTIDGRIIFPRGANTGGVRVTLIERQQSVRPDRRGNFRFESVPPGDYRVTVTGEGYQRLQIDRIAVQANQTVTLAPRPLQQAEDLTRLEPYVVQGKAEPPRPFARSRDALPPRTSIGNIDLPRTENDALPYTIFDREQIVRSGVVGLNEFLQRSVLENDGVTPAPDDSGATIPSGNSVRLRGFEADETVILVNGRRLPEILTSIGDDKRLVGPDVNFIPLSLIQQVEVLPVSASALYSGNAVGGVINIVLRPDIEATEVTATYTNAAQNFDAPQSSVSLLHGRSLLDGKLRLRLNASFTHSIPPVESELGYHQARGSAPVALDAPIYRATPNIRSADNTPLFPTGGATVTSVAPGAGGTGGLAAFAGHEGVRNSDYFDADGGLTASINSVDYAYGRRQRRSAYFGSAIYDIFPWLQLGLDGTYVSTTVNRGYDVFNADLDLTAASPLNPFNQDVKVSLNEITPLLGENYSEARLESSSVVFGALVKLPADWQVSLDSQYARNVTRYRGLALPDAQRWQQLVDEGGYNPLRDTQVGGPPAAFYDRVLVYYGGRGRFVTLGDFSTLDAAVRVSNRKLPLPTGPGTVNFGADYRRSHIDPYTEEHRYGDGSLAGDLIQWSGRTLQRYSAFGELQAQLVPAGWLPRWLRRIEADLAVRYVAADTASETNIAPTLALKADFAGGFSLRGSVTTSSRFPTPIISQRVNAPSGTGGSGSDTLVEIKDRRRDDQIEQVIAKEIVNPNISTEDSVTQTAGTVWQSGKVHRLRLAVDFIDTRKVNELISVNQPQAVIDLEPIFPQRVVRAAVQPGDTYAVGPVTTLYTGVLNLASRHSQSWSTSLDYVWTDCLGGTLEVYGRLLYFQKYDRELTPDGPVVDELTHPDSTTYGLLRKRVNFGAGWSTPKIGFGLDGHYFDARILPEIEWADQGGNRIKPYWQFDAYLQGDLGRFLPWKSSRYGLRGQLRVNNVSGFDYPKYVNESSGAGVQPYGDWRGRTYSLSVTLTF